MKETAFSGNPVKFSTLHINMYHGPKDKGLTRAHVEKIAGEINEIQQDKGALDFATVVELPETEEYAPVMADALGMPSFHTLNITNLYTRIHRGKLVKTHGVAVFSRHPMIEESGRAYKSSANERDENGLFRLLLGPQTTINRGLVAATFQLEEGVDATIGAGHLSVNTTSTAFRFGEIEAIREGLQEADWIGIDANAGPNSAVAKRLFGILPPAPADDLYIPTWSPPRLLSSIVPQLRLDYGLHNPKRVEIKEVEIIRIKSSDHDGIYGAGLIYPRTQEEEV